MICIMRGLGRVSAFLEAASEPGRTTKESVRCARCNLLILGASSYPRLRIMYIMVNYMLRHKCQQSSRPYPGGPIPSFSALLSSHEFEAI
ncbi:hypothetical protein D3C78_1227750 [compost metagenome]